MKSVKRVPQCIRCWSTAVGFLWALSAQNPALATYRFEYLSVADGLSQSRVSAMAEDSRGIMWLGTESGINLYDGYDVLPLNVDESAHPHLLRTRIVALYGDRSNEMWVATTRGVSRIDLVSREVIDVWHHQVHSDERGGRFRQHAQFLEACDGAMVVARSSDVFRLEHSDSGIEQALWLTVAGDETPNPFVTAFSMIKDDMGALWIADTQRLWRSDCETHKLTLMHERDDAMSGSPSPKLVVDHQGVLLWANSTSVVAFDTKAGQAIAEVALEQFLGDDRLWSLVADDEGRIWASGSTGISRWHWLGYGHSDQLIGTELVWDATGLMRLDSIEEPDSMQQVGISGDGLAWIGSEFGLVALDLDSDKDTAHVGELSQPLVPQVSRVYTDRFGVVWFTQGLDGVGRYSPEAHRFEVLQNPNPLTRSARSLLAVEVDGTSYLWVSWDANVLSLWRKSQNNNFEEVPWTLVASESQPDLRMPMVRAMAKGDDGRVWLATSSAIYEADTRTQKVRLLHWFPTYHQDPESMRYPNIGLVFDRNQGRLLYMHSHDVWALSIEGSSMTPDAHLLKWLTLGKTDGAYISLLQLKNGRLAIGSTFGFRLADLEKESWVDHRTGSEGIDPRAVVLSLAEDTDGFLWVGTRGGLGRYQVDADTAQFKESAWFGKNQGLADDTIYAIVVDELNDAWLSTNRGLSRIKLYQSETASIQTTQYGLSDGLPAYEFNRAAMTVDQRGRIFFGGINGITWFVPAQLHPHPRPPEVLLRSLSVNDQPLAWDQPSPMLELPYQENNLALGYTGIHFSAQRRNRYSYWLEGHEANWVMTGADRVARYSNLPSGHYRFWVRAANLDGVWSEPQLLLTAKIEPPPWASPVAYMMYAIFALTLVMSIIWSSRQRQLRLEKLVAERTAELGEKNSLIEAQAKQLEEALEARTLFFANISHEFRTPLTLIQTAIEQLDPQKKHVKASQLAHQYLKRLTRLVDQLLDLSRIRLSGVRTAKEPWSVNQIVGITVDGFEYLAQQRGIELTSQKSGNWLSQVDQASVEKIVLNLLTNALKYTPQGGQVTVSLHGDGDFLELSVIDTGPGIPLDQQELIFERFQRVPSDETRMVDGAGIGLALVREAALAIGGKISLDSEPGRGSIFTLTMPAWLLQDDTQTTQASDTYYLSSARLSLDTALFGAQKRGDVIEPSSVHTAKASSKSILVVEDNPDLRRYLVEMLSDQWRVLQVGNGQEALIQLASDDVDVVLADIMMPQMDGLELLRRVRDDIETSHIPFLILSARHDTETRIKGLTLAADDFLTKPFAPEELKLKLRNVVLSRELLRSAILRQFADVHQPKSEEEWPLVQQQLSPRDHKFLERLNEWLQTEHSRPNLSIVEMADALAVNERTLQRKIKALAGLTPLAFVTRYRLDKAMVALRNPALTIQEIAFDLGFGSQQTFSRAFKQAHGLTPSDWRARYQGQNPSQ